MDPLAFLYISLGVGFLILVIFLCVTLMYVIQILRDISKITDNVQGTVEKVSQTAEKINGYILQPFHMMTQIMEYVKPMLDMIQEKGDAMDEKIQNVKKHFRKKRED